jgi:hypothetical protein
MISPEKLHNALYALQAVLTHAPLLAGKPEQGKFVVGLLDYAEHLPWLLANQADETGKFRKTLEDVAQRYGCAYILRCFDDPVPASW